MRPLTSPSGIFASIVRGAGSIAAETAPAKPMLTANRPQQPAAVAIERLRTSIVLTGFALRGDENLPYRPRQPGDRLSFADVILVEHLRDWSNFPFKGAFDDRVEE